MTLVMSEVDFAEEVRRKIEEGGCSFVFAVYRTLEEHLEKCLKLSGYQIACKKGCSVCCYELVTCTGMEFTEIVKYVRSLSEAERKAVISGTRRAVRAWRKRFSKQRKAFITDTSELVKMYRDWFGRSCPFLCREDGSCRIYPVRPIDCRTTTSLEKCELPHLSAERFRFEPELWANNLILQEEQRRNFEMTTTPLHHWIWITWFAD